ncbi:MAG: tail fiber domain-containing protein [Verrucomicrobiota bacterium]
MQKYFLCALLIPMAWRSFAQGTAFTYQGRLNDGANGAISSYDLRFALFDSAGGGGQLGNLLTNSATAVSNGLFTVTLDFGNQFAGAGRWLEIAVRTNGGSAFTTLTPRQPLTATPYAVFAAGAAALSATGIQPVSLSVNGTNVLRITLVNDTFYGSTTANSVGGSPANVISSGVVGGFIGGGGNGLIPNRVSGDYASVLGGLGNLASGFASTASGYNNTASGYFSTAMGYNNIASGDYATAIGDVALASGAFSMALGRHAQATNIGSFVWADGSSASPFSSTADNQFLIRATGGVGINTASPQGDLHVKGNSVFQGAVAPVADAATNLLNLGIGAVADGFRNGISFYEASTSPAMSLGYDGTAGAGNNALRIYDKNGASLVSFLDGGNVGFGTPTPGRELEVQNNGDTEIGIRSADTGGHLWTLQSSGVTGSANLDASFQIIDRTLGGSRFYIGTNGFVGIGTTNPTNRLHVAGGVSATVFVTTSDRNAKEDFAAVSAADILSKVVALPITSWTFKELPGQRHLGPMAQDFHAAFGLGNTATGIATVDADGVALAAIQGLNQKLQSETTELRRENADLKARLEKLERLLEQRLN